MNLPVPGNFLHIGQHDSLPTIELHVTSIAYFKIDCQPLKDFAMNQSPIKLKSSSALPLASPVDLLSIEYSENGCYVGTFDEEGNLVLGPDRLLQFLSQLVCADTLSPFGERCQMHGYVTLQSVESAEVLPVRFLDPAVEQ